MEHDPYTVQPIETTPKDGSSIALLGSDGRWFSPCEWSPAGAISKDGFWLWWQAEPEYLTEVKNPQGWLSLPSPEAGQ